ncbi:MAG: tetratricopeptide repeat protein [Phycisphaeraceae bacterium]|nr:tetratricopeptide repeat protein [Phycisphaeraceae bacterium]
MRTRTLGALMLSMLAFTPGAADAQPAAKDELRGVKSGEPVPAYKMPTIDGSVVDSQQLKGSVVVMVFLSAEQRRSELAAIESAEVVAAMGNDGVRLVHVTADVIHKDDFLKLRSEHGITNPLAFDSDRTLYGGLGLIVLPATIVVDREGDLAHVILLHRSGYMHELDAYIRNALGELSDEELKAQLAETASKGTPKSLASAHRSLARSMREKGLFDSAREELRKALEMEPGNHEAMLDLCEVDLAMDDLDASERLADQVLEAQPLHRRAQQLKGIIEYHRGRYDDAERILSEAIELNPNPERAHYYLGLICEQRGDKDQALAHYRAAIQGMLKLGKP